MSSSKWDVANQAPLMIFLVFMIYLITLKCLGTFCVFWVFHTHMGSRCVYMCVWAGLESQCREFLLLTLYTLPFDPWPLEAWGLTCCQIEEEGERGRERTREKKRTRKRRWEVKKEKEKRSQCKGEMQINRKCWKCKGQGGQLKERYPCLCVLVWEMDRIRPLIQWQETTILPLSYAPTHSAFIFPQPNYWPYSLSHGMQDVWLYFSWNKWLTKMFPHFRDWNIL